MGLLNIYLFHGVVEKNECQVRNYKRKHLEKDYFSKFLKEALSRGPALSIDDVVLHYQEKREYPEGSFVVSFDDGFENNYSVAAPVLADLNIPAVFYISTGWVDKNLMGWIDRIEYCFEECPTLKIRFPWREDKCTASSRKEKISLLDEIRDRMKKNPQIDKNDFIANLFGQNSLQEVFHSDHPLDKKLNWKQVDEMGRHPLFTIGGHTVTHCIMAQLAEKDLRAEVAASIEMIAKNTSLGRTKHYSYPEGLEYCYSPMVINILKEEGILCSPSAIEGRNDLSFDLFNLRRINVV